MVGFLRIVFLGGGHLDPTSYLKKNLSNINITLCNYQTIYLKYVDEKILTSFVIC